MPAIITSTTGNVRRGATYGINGSGFGSSQEGCKLLLFDSAGRVFSLTAYSWSATAIEVVIPDEDFSPVALGPFVMVIQLAGESLGTRTAPGDEILAAVRTPPTVYPGGTFVFLKPNTMGGPAIILS